MASIRLHHDLVGNPAGETVLMVHGFLSSNVQWDLNVDALGEHHRLVLVELPGHGRSEAPDDRGAYDTQAINAAIEDIRRAVGVERWWVCGQSLGAAIALHYVLAHQHRVPGVIVTNTRAAFGAGRSDPDVDYTTIDLRSVPFHPIHARRFPDDLKERMVQRADAIEAHVLNHMVSYRDRWRVVDDLHRLRMPMLLVNGRYERVFQPFVDDLRHVRPETEIVHLDGGHSINVEQPDAFNHVVLDFIDRHPA